MSFSAKGAGNRELDLGIPDLVSGLIGLDAMVFNDPIGVSFKSLVRFRAEEDEFHLPYVTVTTQKGLKKINNVQKL
ncbi:MAG: hypothetical protein SWH78_17135 [Thermodesulfobacteriota bacterium]|nr:hypothetical protein [Thermodesulfobacteriota bacterium]